MKMQDIYKKEARVSEFPIPCLLDGGLVPSWLTAPDDTVHEDHPRPVLWSQVPRRYSLETAATLPYMAKGTLQI